MGNKNIQTTWPNGPALGAYHKGGGRQEAVVERAQSSISATAPPQMPGTCGVQGGRWDMGSFLLAQPGAPDSDPMSTWTPPPEPQGQEQDER